jgi:hypothetical protein
LTFFGDLVIDVVGADFETGNLGIVCELDPLADPAGKLDSVYCCLLLTGFVICATTLCSGRSGTGGFECDDDSQDKGDLEDVVSSAGFLSRSLWNAASLTPCVAAKEVRGVHLSSLSVPPLSYHQHFETRH